MKNESCSYLLLQTDSPDGSTIHAGRVQKVNAVITQKKNNDICLTFVVTTQTFYSGTGNYYKF